MPRQKKISPTPELLSQIERATGVSLEGDEIVIFEAAALSTKPLSKKGSIFHEARPSRQLLVDMAEAMTTGQASVPLHINHQQGAEMPSGRVFAAAVQDQQDGSSILNAMFYLPKSEANLVEKINLGVLDEVSVGVRSQQGLCSKCGFDYFGDEADFVHLWDQTCDNGHTIGVDGAHLKMVGLADWMELSLVSRGASNRPKIKSQNKDGAPERMAASGVPLDALVLYASAPAPTEIDEMDIKELADKLDAMTARFDALEAGPSEELTAAQARIAELEASATELEAAKAQITELEASAAELEEAKAKIAELTKEPEQEPEPKVEDAPKIPAGGAALSSQSTGEDAKSLAASGAPRASAFKTNRNR